MDEKKPSTADILAKIRAQKAAAAGEAAATPVAAPPEPAAMAPAPVEAVPAAPAEAAPKPTAPVAKPGGTKDILAAIRAQGKGAAQPAAAAAPAVAKPAAAKPAASGAPLPSVADMVRAARQGAVKPAEAVAAEKAAVAPPMPAKPLPKKAAAGAKAAAPDATRRNLSGLVTVASSSIALLVLGWIASSPLLIGLGLIVWGALMSPFAAAWTALTAVTGIATLGTARFMFPNVLVEPPSKFKVGPASDYALNSVSNKWKDQFGIWIVHTDQYEGKNLIYALSTVCTHLGCTPNWLDGEQKYKCPCHGSGFYITGVNFEGPAPRPLERVGLRIAEDGLLEVDKSVKFQEEMGQWVDPSSYVESVS